ncbi:hypothetical protein BPTFM16_00448 [Altererythrobacter insulae]|nr:hypothetical protein BPTFM16_00448 [Altererythrobacter insulae]
MISIYYDGECPFCTRYVQMLRLERGGGAELVNLREADAKRRELEQAGYNLDGGMVVDDGNRLYGGTDAVSYLATVTSPSDLLNKLNRWVFSIAWLARIVYPVLRSGRWFTLFLMNRNLIEDTEDRSKSRREIFSIFFAFFSLFHFFNYAFEYQRFPPTWDLWLVLAAAVALLFKPSSPRVLFALMLISTISTVVQAPVASNHTMVRTAALLGYWLSFITAMVRNDHVYKVFDRFAPAGGAALLVMYFYGVFHKINVDFLDPITSCATTLWRLMPWPLSSLQGPFVDYSAIYGTFVVEGAILVALLIRRFRHYGIAAGIAFHLLLSLSSYAMYISFTTLSIALHSLFLSEEAARNILNSKLIVAFRERLESTPYKLLVITIGFCIAALAFGGNYTLAAVVTFPLVLPFCWAVLRHGAAIETSRRTLPVIGIIVGCIFMVNGAMPYLGLKTAQSINMFANLRLEDGRSNHLVFSADHRPFGYLEDVVTEKETGQSFVYYDVLAWAKANPEMTISYERDGRQYTDQNAQTLKADIDAILLPDWVNKWFHFQPVDLSEKEYCGF